MELDFLTNSVLFWILISWVIVIVTAKVLKLENRGFEIKFYKITYKHKQANSFFLKISSRLKRATKIYADIGIIVSIVTIGFVFWFLFTQISDYFDYSAFVPFPEIPEPSFIGPLIITDFLISISILLIIHKGVKGITSAVEKIKIKTGGIAIYFGIFSGTIEPDDGEIKNAKKISRLRVIGAGAFSIILFWFLLYALLLTNPYFAEEVDNPIKSLFYEMPEGVLVLSIIEKSGAEQAGMLPKDIITSINGMSILSPFDFPILNPGDISEVSVLRDGEKLDFLIDITPSPEDPERGLIGIMRENSATYQPVYNFIEWHDPKVSKFLIWLSKISFLVVIINMLPFPFADGGKLIRIIIDRKLSDRLEKITMWTIYGFTYLLTAFSLFLLYIRSGWFTI